MFHFDLSSLFILFIGFIRFSYGQFEGPVQVQRAFGTTIDLSSYQQTFMFTADDDEAIALYNVSFIFENGECLNPVVSIEFEDIDSDNDNEALYIFYPAFNNDSQIAQCNTATEDSCGVFTLCTEFEPPSGRYDELIFFIGTGNDVDSLCDSPDRSVGGRFTVSCQVDIGSLCTSQEEEEQQQEEEEEGSSSSESRDNAVQEFGHRLSEQHDHDLETDSARNHEANNEVVTVKFDDDTCNSLWSMYVVGLCVCCVAQCGFICVLLHKLNKK